MITIIHKGKATAQSVRFKAWVQDVHDIARKRGYDNPKELTDGEEESLLKMYNRGVSALDALEALE